MQQVALTYDNTPTAAPARRRIIQQPLRTEASFALIASDTAATAELAARLKRTHPLIVFPSISHFLAEPPRRDRWAAIVVARSGAWDQRLDAYVRGRSRMALFGLPEESYGWPDAVARVRDMSELEPWIEALDAPEPAPSKPVRRTRTAAHSAQNRPASQPAAAAPADREGAATSVEVATEQREGPAQRAQPVERTERKVRASTARRAPARARPAPAVRPRELVRSILADHRAQGSAPIDLSARSEFAQAAAELGLVRAFELLDELRARAMQLASGARRRAR